MKQKEPFPTFAEFYPHYLSEHRKAGTRITHFIGTTLFFAWTLSALVFLNPWHFLIGVGTAYFFAWIGHFFIERNKPATFHYPWMSLKGDFRLYFEILGGKEKIFSAGGKSDFAPSESPEGDSEGFEE